MAKFWLSCISIAGMAVWGFLAVALAQDPSGGRFLGAITKVDADARQITLKTDAGAEIGVSMDARATFRKIAPGETNLNNAQTIAISDIHVGDRVLARGKTSDDQKSLAAMQIIVMSQSDIATRQAADRADWDRRGATGVVVDANADQVTINIRTIAGVTPLVIKPGANAVVRRYAPDSVKFADAKPSKFSEIKKGDQVRARGNKTPDGMTMTAEEIVSGQFAMIAGTIVSVDAKENLVRINNLATKKQMTVKILPDSTVKKLPAPIAQVIANRLHGVADDAGPGRGAGGNERPNAPVGAPAGAAQSGRGAGEFAGRGRGGSGGGRGPGDLQQTIDRIPPMTLADLMMGDAIIVSSTVGASADQATAIILLAGVEPILTRPGSREMALGDWNVVGGDLGGLGGFGN